MKFWSRILLLFATLTVLTGCAALGQTPSPTTTHTDASGETVLAEWVNYPAHAYHDGEALKSYPDQTELPPVAADIIRSIGNTISDVSGIELVATAAESTWFSDNNWHAQVGNGYGGESMLITINCCEHTSDVAPDRAKWQAVLDAASRAAEHAGLGPFIVDEQAERCAAADEDCWIVGATANDGVG